MKRVKTIRIAEELLKEIEKMAADDSRNFSNMVTVILTEAVNNYKSENK